MEVVHVIDDLLAGQSPEPDVAAYGEAPAPAGRAERDARDHRVTMAREPFEHPDRIFAVFGLAQHLAVQDNDGVCRQQDFVFRERPGISTALELRKVAGHLRRGQRRGLSWGVTKAEKDEYVELLKRLDLGLDTRLNAKVGLLSGGQRQALTLLMATLTRPRLLLLDEPTNHLDAESILWLEQFLHQYKGAVIAVTHDRYFMDNVAEWICEVDRGHLYPYKGNYSTYLETKAKRMEIQGAKDAKLAKRLKSELDWVRSSPKARQAKNKARLERYDQMEQEARNNKKLDFSEIQIPAGPRLGSTVLEAEHIHKAFGDRVLIDDLSFTLPRNGIVGVIGPNGVGKSTLFKTIVGLEPLTSGSLKIGDTVKISYVDQNRAGLDPNKNLWEAVSDGLDFIEVAGVEVPTRAYVASFGFKGSDQQKLVGVLSGGERNRLNLALTLKQGGNLLLLDEPTNDLDVETLESLENALLAFPGCAVVISHDRWFLDRVATHILAWEGTDENPANWYWFEGNFQAYQENRIARLGEDAARPHRLHRKLTR